MTLITLTRTGVDWHFSVVFLTLTRAVSSRTGVCMYAHVNALLDPQVLASESPAMHVLHVAQCITDSESQSMFKIVSEADEAGRLSLPVHSFASTNITFNKNAVSEFQTLATLSPSPSSSSSSFTYAANGERHASMYLGFAPRRVDAVRRESIAIVQSRFQVSTTCQTAANNDEFDLLYIDVISPLVIPRVDVPLGFRE